MPDSVILDPMIKRGDFFVEYEKNDQIEPIKTLSIESLNASGMLYPLLRKPDFQRETNQWTPLQLVNFLKSFLDSELIPSLILWKSASFVFVIDGGHRISALKAWIEDDYGDGPISNRYYSSEIGLAQKRIAKRTRRLVEDQVGKYSALRDALNNSEGHTDVVIRRAHNMAVRSLDLQWVSGDADKAESSFFKINTQGTPLDKTEELLLRNRRRSVAIAARSIVRAGTGHKYWSKFSDTNIKEIENLSESIHAALFSPEVDHPIKTLDLPLGGTRSPVNALEMLMTLISICDAGQDGHPTPISSFSEDETGDATISVLRKFDKVISRICGNGPTSMGLHPAIYFYSEKGRHMPNLLLGMVSVFSKRIANNDHSFFGKFTRARPKLERYLIENKSLMLQGLQISRSKYRNDRMSDLFTFLIDKFSSGQAFPEEDMFSVLAPNSEARVLAITQKATGSEFSDDTKSSIFLKRALENTIKCPICSGLIDASKSATYDHITRKREGGLGSAENGQIVHPYCNSGVKN